MTMTAEVEVVRTSAVTPFRSGSVMAAAEAKAQVDLIREIQSSVMEEGRDYGIVPGTERPALFKSGAELLLRIHGYGHHNDQIEVERDEHGRKFGVTYRCTVTQGEVGHEVVIATCDGYCGYDESKYYQSTTALEARERANASRYQRPVRADKWAEEYRAPWNTLMKMAIKRALVGAALQACAASGLFAQDLEDMQPEPAVTVPSVPQWQQLGYADYDEMTSVNSSLADMSKRVPTEQAPRVGEAFDAMGYPKGRRLPVAKEHVDAVRKVLLAALNGGADPDTGEVPPEPPPGAPGGDSGAVVDVYGPGEEPFNPEPAPAVFRDDLDDAYLTEDALGNRGRLDLLDGLLEAMSPAQLSAAWDRRGGDPFEPDLENVKAMLRIYVQSANPLGVTSIPPHKQPVAPDPDAPQGQQTLAAEPKKPRSVASGVHAQLAAMGVTAKADQEAVVLVATAGRTTHTSELSSAERAVALGLGRQVDEQTMTLDEIRDQAAKWTTG